MHDPVGAEEEVGGERKPRARLLGLPVSTVAIALVPHTPFCGRARALVCPVH
jgi:hypothetical protein